MNDYLLFAIIHKKEIAAAPISMAHAACEHPQWQVFEVQQVEVRHGKSRGIL
jgi:hypothetical protein